MPGLESACPPGFCPSTPSVNEGKRANKSLLLAQCAVAPESDMASDCGTESTDTPAGAGTASESWSFPTSPELDDALEQVAGEPAPWGVVVGSGSGSGGEPSRGVLPPFAALLRGEAPATITTSLPPPPPAPVYAPAARLIDERISFPPSRFPLPGAACQRLPSPMRVELPLPPSARSLMGLPPPPGLSTPPGLSAFAPVLPAGSGPRGAGAPGPCSWLREPERYHRGQHRCHCRLCPAGEIGTLERAELAARRAPTSGVLAPEGGGMGSGRGDRPWQREDQEALGLPSRGSLLHGTGECVPCAWFWKPQGCQNGQDCERCHLCPEGEVKARKKAKKVGFRVGAAAAAEACGDENDEPAVSGLAGISDPLALPLPPPGIPAPRGASLSRGSLLHPTGECCPCAWFWKPQGCQNGRDCERCHLCPEGEVKARKKVKKAGFREGAAATQRGAPAVDETGS